MTAILNIEQFYILGRPIQTEIGDCHFIRVKDYPDMVGFLGILQYDKNRIIANLTEQDKTGEFQEDIERAKKASLFELVNSIPQYQQMYSVLFSFVFDDENIWDMLNEENFDYFRKLVMKMNGISEEETNPNPEIQRWLDKSKRLNDSEDSIDFSDIVTSVHIATCQGYQQISEYTLLQLYTTFKRIQYFKEHDVTALFSTVPTEKPIEIVNWATHIPVAEKESSSMSEKEFNSTIGKIFE